MDCFQTNQAEEGVGSGFEARRTADTDDVNIEHAQLEEMIRNGLKELPTEFSPRIEELYRDSFAHLKKSLWDKHEWDAETFPKKKKLNPILKDLKSIYSDGATSKSKKKTSKFKAKVDAVAGVLKMQIGTKSQVKEVFERRANDWDDEKVDQIRRKDALWAWVYSRYFYRRTSCISNEDDKSMELFDSDMRETVLMQVMVDSLRGDGKLFDKLFHAYHAANMQKYQLMALDHPGLFRVIKAMR